MSNVQPITVEFVDELPPKQWTGRPPTVFLSSRFAALMERPKQWAVIATAATPEPAGSFASSLRESAKRPHNAGHRWEFASRGNAVYGRYMGEAVES